MTPLEILAALLSAYSVYLTVKQNIWSWPTAIVSVLMYAVVFFEAKLYADMGLQFVFGAVSIYGWYEWLYGGANRTELKVSRTSTQLFGILVVLALTGSVAIGALLHRQTDAAFPWMDSFLASTSLVAQYMMTRKKLENWFLWFFVNVLYIGMYSVKHLYVTAALYAFYQVLAVQGYIQWRKSLVIQPMPALAR